MVVLSQVGLGPSSPPFDLLTLSCVCRNVEADVALRSTAAVFTYCRSRGLFAGISLEGSYLIERKDTNRKCVWSQALGGLEWSRRPWPPCSGVSHPQVLLQRHPCVRHLERRCGAAARVLRPLPHPRGVHGGLHGRLDQQKYASQGSRGRYFIKALHSGRCLAHFFLCLVLPVFWPSIQTSSSPSAESISQLPAASSLRWQWCLFSVATSNDAESVWMFFMCLDGSTGRKNALYPSISMYKSETSSKFSLELFIC